MAMIEQLTEEEWALLMVVSDPILFGEFCRNTADGSPYQDEWPNKPFKYRWYQKDLLSDKSEFIVLTGGRAIGKCSPVFSRIYTHPYGYMSIYDIQSGAKRHIRNIVSAYTVNDDKDLVQRRLRLGYNGFKPIFRITTERGNVFEGTKNHPLLTPKGYIHMGSLKEGDQVGTPTFLPHDSTQDMFSWEELRWFGYFFGGDKMSPEVPIKVKFQRNLIELRQIAEYMDARFVEYPTGYCSIVRKKGPAKHYITHILNALNLMYGTSDGVSRIPYDIKAEKLDNIKIFLESYISTYATVAENASVVKVEHRNKTFIRDIQELLLRFGIESTFQTLENERYQATIADYASIYRLFTKLEIPGYSGALLKMPATKEILPLPYMRWDTITSVEERGPRATWAIHIPETHNYIGDNIFAHNSIVLEDLMVYEAVNAEKEFPNVTKESVLVTPNMAQMTRILNSKISRFSNSLLLKDFLRGNINKSAGTMEFPLGASAYKFFSRIAGTKGETNMVSMHATKIKGDEMQIFPMASFIQLGPGYNSLIFQGGVIVI